MSSGAAVPVLASPIRDNSYRETALGVDIVNFLAWLELGGAADRTLDQHERDLSHACRMYPDRDVTAFTDTELLQVVRSFPPKSRRVRKAAYDSFYRWAMRTRRVEKNPMEMLPRIKLVTPEGDRRLLRHRDRLGGLRNARGAQYRGRLCGPPARPRPVGIPGARSSRSRSSPSPSRRARRRLRRPNSGGARLAAPRLPRVGAPL